MAAAVHAGAAAARGRRPGLRRQGPGDEPADRAMHPRDQGRQLRGRNRIVRHVGRNKLGRYNGQGVGGFIEGLVHVQISK